MTPDADRFDGTPDGLNSHWYIASTARALRRKPIASTVMARDIVLYRSADGTPVALENRCAHRGMPLAEGRVSEGLLQCAYHGWCYDRTGDAVRVPARPPDAVRPAGERVVSFPCHEQDGYVWVCPGGQPTRETPVSFPYLHEKGWSTFRLYNRFAAPVEACLENFLDCPHASFVHRSWFRSPTNRQVLCRVSTLDDGAVAEYFDEPRERSLVWTLLAPAHGDMQHTDRFIAPSTTRVDYVFGKDRHYVITSSCTPVTDTLTDVYTVITFCYGIITPLLRLVFEPLSRRIIAQDVNTLKKQQENLARTGQRNFRVIEQDVLLPHIRRWRHALAEGRWPARPSEPVDVRIVI